LLYNSFFTARRLLLIAVIVFLPVLAFFQMQILVITSVVSVVYVYSFLPFKDMLSAHMEVFNEATLMLMSYMTVSYSDFQPDSYLKYEIGWLMIYLFIFNFVVNILAILSKVAAKVFCKKQGRLRRGWRKRNPNLDSEKYDTLAGMLEKN